MMTTHHMTAKEWLVAVVQSLLIVWGLLYLATILDVSFVREAAGRPPSPVGIVH